MFPQLSYFVVCSKKSRFCDRVRQHFAATLNIILGQVPDNAKPMSTRMFLDQFWRGFLKGFLGGARDVKKMRSRCQYSSAKPMSRRIPDNAKPMSRRILSRCQDTWKSSQNLLHFYNAEN